MRKHTWHVADSMLPGWSWCAAAAAGHLSTQDWGKVAYDLQALGFIPEDVGSEVLDEMAGPLGRILSQLSGGGGATKLNIDAGEEAVLLVCAGPGAHVLVWKGLRASLCGYSHLEQPSVLGMQHNPSPARASGWQGCKQPASLCSVSH